MVSMRCAMLMVSWWSVTAGAATLVDPMRGTAPLTDEPRPPALVNQENKDVRRNRAFAMQPPTIPHRIDGYQVDRNANRCVSCHARGRIEESNAIAIPATHYMDRDGTLRGDVSPRRYFCTQCHVPQDDVKPLIGNTYQDFDALSKTAPKAAPAAARKK
jgi:cytochrome c-type protein NapB